MAAERRVTGLTIGAGCLYGTTPEAAAAIREGRVRVVRGLSPSVVIYDEVIGIAGASVDLGAPGSSGHDYECGFCGRGQCARCSDKRCTCCAGNPDDDLPSPGRAAGTSCGLDPDTLAVKPDRVSRQGAPHLPSTQNEDTPP